jgi:hypothetical protein
MADRAERHGVGRREEDCYNCPDHTGMVEKDSSILTWIKAAFAAASVASGLMAYSVIWQAPSLNTTMARIEERMDGMKSEMKTSDDKLDKRVTYLEDTVFKKK